MIAALKPYPEYKESGSTWLGQVPEHWETRPAFSAFVPNHEHNHGMKEKTVLSLSYGRIVIKPVKNLHGLVPESFETYQIVNPGDIILRTTDLQNDHTSLRVGMVRDRGIITSAYLALRVNDGVIQHFGFQFLNVWDQSKAIYGFGSGLRQNLGFSHFKRMPVALPPLDEQAAIVQFLDWANGRFERAIRAKRKVIALLHEQNQAIIHRAVTRGLDPSVPTCAAKHGDAAGRPLKPSGIPWLGDIPQHWEVRPIKHWAKINTRTLGQSTDCNFQFHYLDIGAVGTGHLVRPPELMQFAKAPSRARRILQPGDTIVSTVRTYLKAIWFVDAEARDLIASTGFAVFSPRPEVEPEYLHYVLQDCSFIDQVTANSIGIAYPAIAETVLARFRVAIPGSRREQQELIAAIKKGTQPLTDAISRLEREIELLREYRTRLVADVVTGKLDVREAAASLPKEDVEEKDLECSEIISDPEDEGEAQEFQVIEVED